MQREHVTQRQLAAQLDISQGHLSKVLRGSTTRDTRTLAVLEAWSGADETTDEAKLIDAVRDVVKGHAHGMQLLMRLMHLLRELRHPGRRRGRQNERR